MELVVSLAIGILTATGVYLVLRERTFSVILGLTLLSYGVNLILFISGRLATNAPPLLVTGVEHHTDPLPQALVLTAIVISFGMTAYLVALALRAKGESGTDHVDAGGADS
jgi:multicomponent K+:H+ antiporter subunit C